MADSKLEKGVSQDPRHIRDEGKPEEAISGFDQELAEAEASGNSRRYYELLQQKAVALVEMGELSSAEHIYHQVAGYYVIEGDNEGLGNVLRDAGLLFFKKKQTQAVAVQALERSAELLKGTKEDPHGVALSLGKLAMVYGKLGRNDEAEEKFRQAVELAEEAFKQDSSWWANVTVRLDYAKFLGENNKSDDALDQAGLALDFLNKGLDLEEGKTGIRPRQTKRYAQIYGLLWLVADDIPGKEQEAEDFKELYERYLGNLENENQKRSVEEFLGVGLSS